MTIGQRIYNIRTEQKLTQKQFAKLLGVSDAAVCLYERGKSDVSNAVKANICQTFHVNPTWLDTGEGEQYSHTGEAESLVPELVDILNENPMLLKLVRKATEQFSLGDWKKLNDYVEKLEVKK